MKNSQYFKFNHLNEIFYFFKNELIVVGIFSLIVNILMLVPTLYMLQVYDRIMLSMNYGTLIIVSLITLYLFFVLSVSEYFRSKILIYSGVKLELKLNPILFKSSFTNYLNGKISNQENIFSDLTIIRQFITGNGIFAFFDAPWIPIYITILYFLHPNLGVIALLFLLIQMTLAWWTTTLSKPAHLKAIKAELISNNLFNSKFKLVETLEPMGMVGNLYKKWEITNKVALYNSLNEKNVNTKLMSISKFIRYSQQSLTLGAGAMLVLKGEISPGAMIAANVLMSRALAPVDLLVSVWNNFIGVKESYTRLSEILKTGKNNLKQINNLIPSGEVTISNLQVQVKHRKIPILNINNLQLRKGDVTVVLGESGSGKSTLARVLLGIQPTISGEVSLDGMEIHSWNRSELGPHLGYLPQEIELFDTTIAENIARSGEVDSQKVIAAAEEAGLHQMILRFPQGYDTPIGEAGEQLSGGQRQRIGLARAIYGDPKLVVLDEPNANLDEEGEIALIRAVTKLKDKGSTVVLISHRPNIIGVADNLIILHDGMVQLIGTRDYVLSELKKKQEIQQY
jgi:ATP-binding cassette subfamily C exporter for protease/lipase